MIKSKLSIYIITGMLFFIFFICLIAYFSITKINLWENSKKIAIPNIFLVIFMLLLNLLFLYWILKITPNVTIGNNYIRIRNVVGKTKELKIGDISLINLFATGNMMSWSTIVTRIELINGKKIIIPDPNYKNIGKLKQALVENFREKIKPYKNENPSPALLKEEVLKFSGNPFTSFNTLLFMGLMVSTGIITLLPGTLRTLHDMAIAGLFIFMYFLTGLQMHYFLISKEYIIVKNHYFFWFKKCYKTENVIAMNFEFPGRQSKSLRITTKDFKSRYYSAGSLRDKTWDELKEYIKSQGIYFID